MDKRLNTFTDGNLRDISCDPEGLRAHIGELKSLLPTSDIEQDVSILGRIGVFQRRLEELDKAEETLTKVLNIIRANQLNLKWEIQQKIRLAHVLQWKRNFSQSNKMLEDIISVCRSNDDVKCYLDFALQHAGKNLFDQKKYQEALIFFHRS